MKKKQKKRRQHRVLMMLSVSDRRAGSLSNRWSCTPTHRRKLASPNKLLRTTLHRSCRRGLMRPRPAVPCFCHVFVLIGCVHIWKLAASDVFSLSRLGMRFAVCVCVCVQTWLQVKLAEVLGCAECDHNHTVALYILSRGHLEGEVRSGDQAVLLHQRVDRLHPAVPEVNPEQTQRPTLKRPFYGFFCAKSWLCFWALLE